MSMRTIRPTAVARFLVLVVAGLLLASCSGGIIGDLMPHWVGGLPKNAPPRPGTPEYEAYKQHLSGEAARDKSKDDPDKSKDDAAPPQQ